MNTKKQSNLKINECSKKDNQSKILKLLNEIDCGKMVLALSGFSICAPTLFPSISNISVNELISLIPTISHNLTSIGIVGLTSVSSYLFIDNVSEILKDINLGTKKETTKEFKKYSIIETSKDNSREIDIKRNKLVINLNKEI